MKTRNKGNYLRELLFDLKKRGKFVEAINLICDDGYLIDIQMFVTTKMGEELNQQWPIKFDNVKKIFTGVGRLTKYNRERQIIYLREGQFKQG